MGVTTAELSFSPTSEPSRQEVQGLSSTIYRDPLYQDFVKAGDGKLSQRAIYRRFLKAQNPEIQSTISRYDRYCIYPSLEEDPSFNEPALEARIIGELRKRGEKPYRVKNVLGEVSYQYPDPELELAVRSQVYDDALNRMDPQKISAYIPSMNTSYQEANARRLAQQAQQERERIASESTEEVKIKPFGRLQEAVKKTLGVAELKLKFLWQRRRELLGDLTIALVPFSQADLNKLEKKIVDHRPTIRLGMKRTREVYSQWEDEDRKQLLAGLPDEIRDLMTQDPDSERLQGYFSQHPAEAYQYFQVKQYKPALEADLQEHEESIRQIEKTPGIRFLDKLREKMSRASEQALLASEAQRIVQTRIPYIPHHF